jgi:hypothetical protein
MIVVMLVRGEGRMKKKAVKVVPQAAEFFWRLFEKTGSIAAYMMYRRLLLQ